VDEFFQVVLSFLDQNGKGKFLDLIFGERNVSISRGDIHVLSTGNFVSIFNEQVQRIQWRNEIKADRLFLINLKLEHHLIFLIVHQISKRLPILQIDEFVVFVDSGQSVLAVV
jgi:hypothetical protein